MDERIHRALDGELDPTQLTPDQRAEFIACSQAIRDTTSAYRSLEVPDLTAAVMTRIAELDAPPPSTAVGVLDLLAWLWRPRPVLLAWRPVYAAAVAVLVVGASLWAGLRPAEIAPTAEATSSAEATAIYVQFRLDAPGASTVQVVGSFTDWSQPVELFETIPGVWSTMLPLEPGVHDYTFIVDGDRWVVDPLAPAVEDGFGGSKNRLFLTRPTENA